MSTNIDRLLLHKRVKRLDPEFRKRQIIRRFIKKKREEERRKKLRKKLKRRLMGKRLKKKLKRMKAKSKVKEKLGDLKTPKRKGELLNRMFSNIENVNSSIESNREEEEDEGEEFNISPIRRNEEEEEETSIFCEYCNAHFSSETKFGNHLDHCMKENSQFLRDHEAEGELSTDILEKTTPEDVNDKERIPENEIIEERKRRQKTKTMNEKRNQKYEMERDAELDFSEIGDLYGSVDNENPVEDNESDSEESDAGGELGIDDIAHITSETPMKQDESEEEEVSVNNDEEAVPRITYGVVGDEHENMKDFQPSTKDSEVAEEDYEEVIVKSPKLIKTKDPSFHSSTYSSQIEEEESSERGEEEEGESTDCDSMVVERYPISTAGTPDGEDETIVMHRNSSYEEMGESFNLSKLILVKKKKRRTSSYSNLDTISLREDAISTTSPASGSNVAMEESYDEVVGAEDDNEQRRHRKVEVEYNDHCRVVEFKNHLDLGKVHRTIRKNFEEITRCHDIFIKFKNINDFYDIANSYDLEEAFRETDDQDVGMKFYVSVKVNKRRRLSDFSSDESSDEECEEDKKRKKGYKIPGRRIPGPGRPKLIEKISETSLISDNGDSNVGVRRVDKLSEGKSMLQLALSHLKDSDLLKYSAVPTGDILKSEEQKQKKKFEDFFEIVFDPRERYPNEEKKHVHHFIAANKQEDMKKRILTVFEINEQLDSEAVVKPSIVRIVNISDCDHENVMPVESVYLFSEVPSHVKKVIHQGEEEKAKNGWVYFVLEMSYFPLSLIDLFKKSSKVKLDKDSVKLMMKGVLLGLQEFHRRKIVHTDLNSSLIFFEEIAGAPGEDVRVTYSPRLLGVRELPYEGKDTKVEDDIMSFGKILLDFMICFKSVIERRDILEEDEVVLEKISRLLKGHNDTHILFTKENVESLRKILNEVELDICIKLLEHDPTKRLNCESALKHPYFLNYSSTPDMERMGKLKETIKKTSDSPNASSEEDFFLKKKEEDSSSSPKDSCGSQEKEEEEEEGEGVLKLDKENIVPNDVSKEEEEKGEKVTESDYEEEKVVESPEMIETKDVMNSGSEYGDSVLVVQSSGSEMEESEEDSGKDSGKDSEEEGEEDNVILEQGIVEEDSEEEEEGESEYEEDRINSEGDDLVEKVVLEGTESSGSMKLTFTPVTPRDERRVVDDNERIDEEYRDDEDYDELRPKEKINRKSLERIFSTDLRLDEISRDDLTMIPQSARGGRKCISAIDNIETRRRAQSCGVYVDLSRIRKSASAKLTIDTQRPRRYSREDIFLDVTGKKRKSLISLRESKRLRLRKILDKPQRGIGELKKGILDIDKEKVVSSGNASESGSSPSSVIVEAGARSGSFTIATMVDTLPVSPEMQQGMSQVIVVEQDRQSVVEEDSILKNEEDEMEVREGENLKVNEEGEDEKEGEEEEEEEGEGEESTPEKSLKRKVLTIFSCCYDCCCICRKCSCASAKCLLRLQKKHERKVGTILLVLQMVVILYNTATVPYRIAFEENTNWVFRTFDILMDLCVWMNMLYRFTRRARGYETCKGLFLDSILYFCLEFLLVLPLDYAFGSPWFRFPRILLLFFFPSLISKFETSLSLHFNLIYFRILKYSFYLLVLIHYFACLWFIVATQPSNFMNFTVPEPLSEHFIHASLMKPRSNKEGEYSYSSTHGRQYMTSLYFAAFYIIGFAAPFPQDVYQSLYSMFAVIFGAFFFATIIGTVSATLFRLNITKQKFEDKMGSIQEFMKFKNVSKVTRRKVLRYYMFIEKSGAALVSPDKIFSDLDNSLKMKMYANLHMNLVRKVDIFQRCAEIIGDDGEDFINDICSLLSHVFVLEGSYVVRYGDIGKSMYFIGKGKVDVVLASGITVVTLKKGSFFGEISLFLNDQSRTANVVASENCELYELTKSGVRVVLRKHPEAAKLFSKEAKRRLMDLKKKQEEQRRFQKIRRKLERRRRKVFQDESRARSEEMSDVRRGGVADEDRTEATDSHGSSEYSAPPTAPATARPGEEGGEGGGGGGEEVEGETTTTMDDSNSSKADGSLSNSDLDGKPQIMVTAESETDIAESYRVQQQLQEKTGEDKGKKEEAGGGEDGKSSDMSISIDSFNSNILQSSDSSYSTSPSSAGFLPPQKKIGVVKLQDLSKSSKQQQQQQPSANALSKSKKESITSLSKIKDGNKPKQVEKASSLSNLMKKKKENHKNNRFSRRRTESTRQRKHSQSRIIKKRSSRSRKNDEELDANPDGLLVRQKSGLNLMKRSYDVMPYSKEAGVTGGGTRSPSAVENRLRIPSGKGVRKWSLTKRDLPDQVRKLRKKYGGKKKKRKEEEEENDNNSNNEEEEEDEEKKEVDEKKRKRRLEDKKRIRRKRKNLRKRIKSSNYDDVNELESDYSDDEVNYDVEDVLRRTRKVGKNERKRIIKKKFMNFTSDDSEEDMKTPMSPSEGKIPFANSERTKKRGDFDPFRTSFKMEDRKKRNEDVEVEVLIVKKKKEFKPDKKFFAGMNDAIKKKNSLRSLRKRKVSDSLTPESAFGAVRRRAKSHAGLRQRPQTLTSGERGVVRGRHESDPRRIGVPGSINTEIRKVGISLTSATLSDGGSDIEDNPPTFGKKGTFKKFFGKF